LKTTSAGIYPNCERVVSFYFAFKSTSLNEATIAGVLTLAVLGELLELILRQIQSKIEVIYKGMK
jgi:hypothetical protein